MKKKVVLNLVIGIGALIYLIYQIWDITQTSKKNTNFKPDYIKATIKNSQVLSLLDSTAAYQIATCFYDKFVQKYGRDKLIEVDTKYGAGDTSVYRIFAAPIMDSCILPFELQIKEARALNNCIHSFTKRKRPEAERKAFCECFMEKQKLKYGNGYLDSASNDSVLKIDLVESGCGELLSK